MKDIIIALFETARTCRDEYIWAMGHSNSIEDIASKRGSFQTAYGILVEAGLEEAYADWLEKV